MGHLNEKLELQVELKHMPVKQHDEDWCEPVRIPRAEQDMNEMKESSVTLNLIQSFEHLTDSISHKQVGFIEKSLKHVTVGQMGMYLS